MKVREERILADRKLAKSGAQLEQILAACWEETIDPGPYAFGDRIDWGQVLQGDRFYALLQLRIATYGPEYAFAVTCEKRSCRARIEWELNLSDLVVRPLPGQSRVALQAGNRFTATFPDAARAVTFRLLTGADERRLAAQKHAADEHPITTMLLTRIESVEGVEPKDKRRFIEDLAMGDVSLLLGEFDRVDCGVETEIEIECPECLSTQRLELPFERGFFLPERARKPTCSPASNSTAGVSSSSG
jgi:hypothetical protein